MSDSAAPWTEHTRTRYPCPSLPPGAYSDSRPSRWWCHPAISSSVVPFSSCPQSFPASGSFPISWVLASGGQRIEASVSVLPVNIQGLFPLGLTPLVWSHCCPGDLQDLLQHHNSKASVLWRSAFFLVPLSYLYETTGKTTVLTIWTFVCSVMSGF